MIFGYLIGSVSFSGSRSKRRSESVHTLTGVFSLIKRAFTLIELLTVIAIISVLAAILFPVFLAARSAAYQIAANGAIGQTTEAEILYSGDYDDTFMPAMYNGRAFQAWFGVWSGSEYVPGTGLLSPYERKAHLKDLTAHANTYLGDHTGFGYNWGFIGSDFHVTRNYRGFPNCKNPATSTQLADPSETVVFATSGYYSAPWINNGDGQMYDFGFIDPVSFCGGNPNVDFRHVEPRTVNLATHTITFGGNAVVAMADGHVQNYKIGALKDIYFTRGQLTSDLALNGSSLP
jgi:prepilin-type N-terminal cleavage/methylation domain-containing protein/prepilin-type processing-associated H-X9-DG protein